MSPLKTKRALRAAAAAATFGAMLAGCSDPGLYFDRRETIALTGGDSIAANAAEQTVDPWPRHSGNNNIAFNGQRAQAAQERYRTGRVTPPANIYNSALESLKESTPAVAGGTAGGPASGATAAAAPPTQ